MTRYMTPGGRHRFTAPELADLSLVDALARAMASVESAVVGDDGATVPLETLVLAAAVIVAARGTPGE